MDRGFWKDKRVLVTGADGFIGSHLTEKLIEYGADVTVLTRGTSVSGTTERRYKNISHLRSKFNPIFADVGDVDCIRMIIDKEPEIIYHLAAVAYVPYSFDHPFETIRANFIGTLNVLESARQMRSLERLVVTSSSEVYGTARYIPIDENHPLNPTSPYAASKVAADRMSFSFWKTYGTPISIVRPFNTYGPRHTYDVIPKFIKMVLSGEPPTIYGDGEQTRDFTYVDDTVSGFLAIGSNEKTIGEVINLGTGVETRIRDLAEKIIDICDSPLKPIFVESRAAEVNRLCCNNSKAKRLVGWEPKISLYEGLRRNIQWCRDNWFKPNAKKDAQKPRIQKLMRTSK